MMLPPFPVSDRGFTVRKSIAQFPPFGNSASSLFRQFVSTAAASGDPLRQKAFRIYSPTVKLKQSA